MRFVGRGLSDRYRRAVDGHSPWTADVRDAQPICIDHVERADLDESSPRRSKRKGSARLHSSLWLPAEARWEVHVPLRHFPCFHGCRARSRGRRLPPAWVRRGADPQSGRAIVAAQLRESEARERTRAAELRTIMEAVPAVIWIARDRDCCSISGNTASYVALRLSTGREPVAVSPEAERPSNFEVLWMAAFWRRKSCSSSALPAAKMSAISKRKSGSMTVRPGTCSATRRPARRRGQSVGGSRVRRHYGPQEGGRSATCWSRN